MGTVQEYIERRRAAAAARDAARAEGRRRYWTGVPCRRGHLSERHAVNGACVECMNFHNRNNSERKRGAVPA